MTQTDAVVVGSGPNGLAAAITLARAGRSVLVLEGEDELGGGCRSGALTLPGFTHDICAAVHPMAVASPFFETLELQRYGLELLHPPIPLAHPLDDGTAATLERDVAATAASLDRDAASYQRLMAPLTADADKLFAELLRPLRFPHHPLALSRFGVHAIRSAAGFARSRFHGARARALFAGLAAHSMLPLEQVATAGFGLVFGVLGHAYGWPVVRGGSRRIVDALALQLNALGGVVVTGRPVRSLADVPPARAVLFDVTPRQLLAIAGGSLPSGYRRRLERFRYGPGAFKVDWALGGMIPWTAPACRRAGTVHVGGTLPEIVASEAAVARGECAERPYVLVAQQSLFDETRAPAGKHAAWAYCHVPNASAVDMTERIEAQIERFAPGFRELVLARSVRSPAELERYNANCIGGDINGGAADLRQAFTRPDWHLYSTPNPRLYLCSSSTPPGGGVHGMCGMYAAQAALRRALR
jgi:phytoene dehydrogenase-like protein